MTRKATAKKPKAAAKAKPAKAGLAKKPKKAAKPHTATAYVVVREIPAESPSFSDPERVFAKKDAAQKFAEERNRELRRLVNPFAERSAQYLLNGGEKALTALVKKLKLPAPAKHKTYGSYIDWEGWWDGHYFDMTDAQRDAIWDALDKYDWYTVKTTKLEG
jgi:hypothetical protein